MNKEQLEMILRALAYVKDEDSKLSEEYKDLYLEIVKQIND